MTCNPSNSMSLTRTLQVWKISILKSGWCGYVYIGLFTMFHLSTVETSCVSGVTELWAYGNPSSHPFKDSYNKYINSDKGSVCRWIITASKSNHVVKLNFPFFKLKQSKGDASNDCLEIYDGKSEEADLLEEACDSRPKAHTSSGRYLFVVYKRGEKKGKRQFKIVIESKNEMDKDQIIRIALIVGGSIAAFVFLYVVCKATKCCSCLRDKVSENVEVGNNHEQDHLTRSPANVQNETVAAAMTSGSHLITPAGAASTSANALGEEADSVSLPSDTPSLHELNEPPPSYESLYLNEDGLAPPEYTPPLHKKSHPPRRVHTFN